MLKPIDTKDTNIILGAPQSWDAEKDGNCIGLPCFRDIDNNVFHSYWELTDEERAIIAHGGTIKLSVFGNVHAPVSIDVSKTSKLVANDDKEKT